jgi:hypothetical protein
MSFLKDYGWPVLGWCLAYLGGLLLAYSVGASLR